MAETADGGRALGRQILFIQGGGGSNVHDEWDDKLVASLSRELGAGWEVRYPRMPDEDDPSYAKWKPAILQEIAMCSCEGRSPDSFAGTGPLPSQGNSVVLVGHSIGGTMMVGALAERPPEADLAAIILIAAPFVGEGGWPGDEFELPSDLGAKLPQGVPVHVFHGSEDDTAPPAHADLYARAIPQAKAHRLPGRDHQLNNDLSEVADVIRAI